MVVVLHSDGGGPVYSDSYYGLVDFAYCAGDGMRVVGAYSS